MSRILFKKRLNILSGILRGYERVFDSHFYFAVVGKIERNGL